MVAGQKELMNLKDAVALIPEDKRADVEKAIQEAIVAANPVAGIDSPEKAMEFIKANRVFLSALDSEISKKIEKHDTEVVPKKVKEELDKRSAPETDPIKIALREEKEARLKLEADLKAERDATKREKLLNAAMKKASDAGIPTKFIHRFLEEDEDRTNMSVDELIKEWKGYTDSKIEERLKGQYGDRGQPKGGNTPPPNAKTMKRADFEALPDAEKSAFSKDHGTLID